MKKGTVVKISLSILVSVLVLAGTVVFWWVHTPYFAVQQVAAAIVKRDQATFYEFVEVKHLVEELTNDLLCQPAYQTPGLSEMQRYVAAGAVLLWKTKIDRALLSGIDRWVSPQNNISFGFDDDRIPSETRIRNARRLAHRTAAVDNRTNRGFSGEAIEISLCNDRDETPVVCGSRTTHDTKLISADFSLKEFTRAVGHELNSEQDNMKRLAAQRMREYAESHQEKLIGRLFSPQQQGRSNSLRQLFTEYGLSHGNVKKMYFHRDDDRQICTVEFFSPKIQANVPFSIELTPVNPSEIFSKWKIVRVWKLKESLKMLGEDTDQQVQSLVSYTMQDITPQNAVQRTGELIKRIGEKDVTKQLLQQLRGRFDSGE